MYIMDPSLQIRGQSPLNCPDLDVKMWGQNIFYCLVTNENSVLFHILMLLTFAKVQIKF